MASIAPNGQAPQHAPQWIHLSLSMVCGMRISPEMAFQEPYRLVKLRNRTELSDYLMEKYDTAWDQDTTRPFIMENDSLMEGYRANPLDSLP